MSLEYLELYEKYYGFKFIFLLSYDVVILILSAVLTSHKIHIL